MFARIKALFNRLTAFLFSDGGVVIRDAVAGILETLGPVATTLLVEEARRKVASLDGAVMPNETKRKAAEDYLKGYAANAIPAATQSMIEFAVLAAVRALRAK